MKKEFSGKLLTGRLRSGPFGTPDSNGAWGQFLVQGPCGEKLLIISNGGDVPASQGWEHVSVSTKRRPPNWQEMCFVKDLFWDDEECVIQFHPPKSEHINNHPYCLHLWRPMDDHVRLPPSVFVGLKSEDVSTPKGARQLRIVVSEDS